MDAAHDSQLARALSADTPQDAMTARILDAAVGQFRAFGIRRSTVEDVARRAGVGRVTIYRRFENKNKLVEAVLVREAQIFLTEFNAVVAPLPTMEERIVEGFGVAVQGGREALIGRLLELEPETTLPFLTVEGGPILAVLRDYLAAAFQHAPDTAGVDGREAARVAELFVRIAVSFLLTPDSCVPVDEPDQAKEFARRYLAPMVTQAQRSS